MSYRRARLPASLTVALAALLVHPAAIRAQGRSPERVQVALGGGWLTSGDYFRGPGGLALDNGDAFAGNLQVSVAVYRSIGLVLAVAHARPDWRLSGVPLIGSIGVPGARLWFGDVAVRAHAPLGRTARPPTVFAQAGAGLVDYAVDTRIVGRSLDEHATNFAVTLGAGAALPLTDRLGLELLAKDYIVSFKSVQDLAAVGVEGRRAHTLLLTVSARLGL
jgi:opacity protein-like surface antigen